MGDNPRFPQCCILFATADWDTPYWTNKQHCTKSLASLGVEVLYVESLGIRSPNPLSRKDWKRILTRLYRGIRSLVFGARKCEKGIYVLSPLLIPAGHRHQITRWFNRFLLKAAITRAAAQKSFLNPMIWTYHPFVLDFIDGLDRGPLLYHCVDDLAAIPGVDANSFRKAEIALIRKAKVVFATSPHLADYCLQYNDNTQYMSNVVDAEHFGIALKPGPIPTDLAVIPEPRLAYHGVLSDFKLDFQLLIDAARQKPEWSWIFIGDEREGQKSEKFSQLKGLPNVYHLGYRNYEMLPQYLRGMQVGLLPSKINDYTRSMFPMKYYEYLAAGVPVISTKIDFTRTLGDNLAVASDLTEFIEKIEKLITVGRLSKEQSAHFVGDNTWLSRTARMVNETYIDQQKR